MEDYLVKHGLENYENFQCFRIRILLIFSALKVETCLFASACSQKADCKFCETAQLPHDIYQPRRFPVPMLSCFTVCLLVQQPGRSIWLNLSEHDGFEWKLKYEILSPTFNNLFTFEQIILSFLFPIFYRAFPFPPSILIETVFVQRIERRVAKKLSPVISFILNFRPKGPRQLIPCHFYYRTSNLPAIKFRGIIA